MTGIELPASPHFYLSFPSTLLNFGAMKFLSPVFSAGVAGKNLMVRSADS